MERFIQILAFIGFAAIIMILVLTLDYAGFRDSKAHDAYHCGGIRQHRHMANGFKKTDSLAGAIGGIALAGFTLLYISFRSQISSAEFIIPIIASTIVGIPLYGFLCEKVYNVEAFADIEMPQKDEKTADNSHD
jgi:hypothetical protein